MSEGIGHHADEADQATAQELASTEDAIRAQQLQAQARSRRYAPREDGLCACGCDREVNPRRLALGYGLAIECAERMDKR